MLTTPYGATLQNFNTMGTHDVAVFDLNGDGYKDMISALCTGYKVFIQVPPIPIGLYLQINEPAQGAVSLQITQGTPNTPVYNLVSTQIIGAGSGPFFGLSNDAFLNFVAMFPFEPAVGQLSGSGAYTFSLPAGSLPAGFQVQSRSVQTSGSTYTTSNVVNKTF